MALKLLTQTLLKEIEAMSVDDDIASFSYIGFSPEKLLATLQSIESNESALIKDVVSLLVLATLRGTNFAKAVKKMDKGGAAKIASLAQKYRLKANASGGDADSITLTRLMAAFPLVTLMIRIKCGSPFVGALPVGLPAAFAFPSGAALIPADDDTRYKLWVTWAQSFNGVIKGTGDVEAYGRIAWNSNVVNIPVRVATVEKYWKV